MGEEEAFDFFGAGETSGNFHEPLAAWAVERILAPDVEDEIKPEGAEVAGALRSGRRDGGGFQIGRTALPRLDFHSPALVGVAAKGGNGVLVLRRDAFDSGSEEFPRGEELEVSRRVPTAPGSVDDALALCRPDNLL